jgi:hypothetical protein
MSLRVILATAILRPPLAVALIPYLMAPFLVGLIIVLHGFKQHEEDTTVKLPSNPLQVFSALQMVLLFQLVLFAVYAVRSHWGDVGLLLSGAVLGFTDVDALTISMAKSADGQIPVAIAAEAVAVGVLSNTILKLLLAVVLGKARFRKLTSAWMTAMAIGSAVFNCSAALADIHSDDWIRTGNRLRETDAPMLNHVFYSESTRCSTRLSRCATSTTLTSAAQSSCPTGVRPYQTVGGDVEWRPGSADAIGSLIART